MPGSIRSGPSSPGRAILFQDAAFSVDAFCKCGKPWLGRYVGCIQSRSSSLLYLSIESRLSSFLSCLLSSVRILLGCVFRFCLVPGVCAFALELCLILITCISFLAQKE